MKELQQRSLTGCRRLVTQLLDRRLHVSDSLYHRDLRSHHGCINAVEFSSSGQLLVSGGDDRRVLLWNVSRTLSGGGRAGGGHVQQMASSHLSNIFSLAFDCAEKRVISAGNDKQIIVHDIDRGCPLDVFTEQQAVYGVSTSPCDDSVFVAACENGRVLLFDMRMSLADPYPVVGDTGSLASFYSAMFSPGEPQLIATANSKTGAATYDIRFPTRPLLRYGESRYGAMSARFSADGTRLLVLRRRLPPALYDIRSPVALCQFDHPRYYNSCTMKSCCFAGDRDQYVLSGSDDFNLYMWRVPDVPTADTGPPEGTRFVKSAHMILRGHRSIVNQVRYCRHTGLLASSGVEKIIKLWSMVELPGCSGGLTSYDASSVTSRRVYRHGEYLDMVVDAGDLVLNDASQQSTEEDPRMMAFFDSLIQREIDGLTTETDTSSEEDGQRPSGAQLTPADSASAVSESYFAAAGPAVSSVDAADNIISQMIGVKRCQLMRAARQRQKRRRRHGPLVVLQQRLPQSQPQDGVAEAGQSRLVPFDATAVAAGNSSGAVVTVEDGWCRTAATLNKRVFHKTRYVWLPSVGGDCDSDEDSNGSPSNAVDSSSSPSTEPRALSPPVAVAGCSSSSAGHVQLVAPPCGPNPQQPSGSGIRSWQTAKFSRACYSSPEDSTSSASSVEDMQENVSGRKAHLISPEAEPLTNGTTKNNMERSKGGGFRGRNYRNSRRHR